MASPEAARSPWVQEEVRHWLATKGPETLLLARTGSAILWDRTARDFDWGATTVLPPALRGRFRGEPLHVDLTGLGERADDLALHDTRFAGAVLRLAATLHDTSTTAKLRRRSPRSPPSAARAAPRPWMPWPRRSPSC